MTAAIISVAGSATAFNQDYTRATTFGAGGVYTSVTSFSVTGTTTLSGNATFTQVLGGSSFNFSDTISGAGNILTVAGGTGVVTFGGAIGPAGNELASVTVSGVTITVGDVSTTGVQSYTGATTLNSTYTTAGGGFTVDGAAVLASATTINTGNGAGTVTFTSTIEGTAGTETLTITAGVGAVQFSGAVGGNTSLQSVTASGVTVSALSVTTAGVQSYTGTTTLNGTYTTTDSSFTVSGAATLGGATAVSRKWWKFEDGVISG